MGGSLGQGTQIGLICARPPRRLALQQATRNRQADAGKTPIVPT